MCGWKKLCGAPTPTLSVGLRDTESILTENILCVLYFRAVSQYFWSLAICDYFNFCQQEKELFSTQELCYYNIIYM